MKERKVTWMGFFLKKSQINFILNGFYIKKVE